MSYRVLGSLISPFVRKVVVLLKEKGLDYEHEDVNPFAPPDGFRDLSPLGLIPVLQHGDRTINDSSVICRYIDRVDPSPSFYPADAYDCARAEWIEEYMDAGFTTVAGREVFQPLVLRPLMTGEKPDEAAVQKVIDEKIPRFYDYLEAQIGSSGYFVGAAQSIADIAVAASFVSARLAGVAPAATGWPKLHAHLKRMHGRDSFQAVIEPVVGFLGERWVELD